MKKTLSVDIISSCACQYALELGDKATKNNNYKVEFFYQAISPFSLYSQPFDKLKSLTVEQLVYGSASEMEMVLADVHKNAFEKIGSEKRDNYLILDLTDFSRSLYQLASDEPSYLTKTDPTINNLSVFEDYVDRTIDPQILSRKYINSCLDKYVDDLLKLYDANKIIICEVYHAKSYVSKNKTIKHFISPVLRHNRFIEECYEYVENAISKRQEGLHIIKMPKSVLGNEAHELGNDSLHFCNEIYEYLFSAIDVVCSNYERNEEEQILDSFKTRCQGQLDLIRSESELVLELDAKEEIIQATQEKLQSVIAENERLEAEKKELLAEIERIKISKSYKIGRLITYLPRKLRGKRKN